MRWHAAGSRSTARGRLRPASSQADLDRPSRQVEGSQIITLHETDQVMKLLDIERISRPRGFLRHSFTPHGQALERRRSGSHGLGWSSVSNRAAPDDLATDRRTYSIRTESRDLAMCERTSQPSGVTSTSSSIRMPPQSGR